MPNANVFRSLLLALLVASCASGSAPQGRKRSPAHDQNCKEEARPQAFMYPATNRDFGPADPKADGRVLAVPDHLFCCPAPKP